MTRKGFVLRRLGFVFIAKHDNMFADLYKSFLWLAPDGHFGEVAYFRCGRLFHVRINPDFKPWLVSDYCNNASLVNSAEVVR